MSTPLKKGDSQQGMPTHQSSLHEFFPSRSAAHLLPGGVTLIPGKAQNTSRGAKVIGTGVGAAASSMSHSAHSNVRAEPARQQEDGEETQPSRRPSIRHNNTPCKYFAATGRCKYGDKCTYLHQEAPARGYASTHPGDPRRVASSSASNQPPSPAGDGSRVRTVPPRRHQSESKASAATSAPPGGRPAVVLPWDSSFGFKGSNGKWCRHWDAALATIQEQVDVMVATSVSLDASMHNSAHEVLVPMWLDLLRSALPHRELCSSFAALEHALLLLPSEDIVFLTTHTLPWMVGLMVRAEGAIFAGDTDVVPILASGSKGALTFTQEQCALLVVCAFFSLYPYRSYKVGSSGRCPGGSRKELVPFTGPRGRDGYGRSLGSMNMASLFAARAHGGGGGGNYTAPNSLLAEHRFAHPDSSVHNKVRCILHYFMSLCRGWSDASLRTRRIEFARWLLSENTTGITMPPSSGAGVAPASPFNVSSTLSVVQFDSELLIEKADGLLQVDFANSCLGGGVLGRGCVQEEIRFVVCPDMFVARLVCENLGPLEAVLMNGCEQYCDYSGYGKSFSFKCTLPKATIAPAPPHQSPIANVCVVAIDATNFNATGLRPEFQYRDSWIRKDFHKALVGFLGSNHSSLEAGRPVANASTAAAIATGHWGCGAFGGDRELKFLLQWVAASLVRRNLLYCSFGDTEFNHRCQAFCAAVASTSPGQLLSAVLRAGSAVTELFEDGLASFPLGHGLKREWKASQPMQQNYAAAAEEHLSAPAQSDFPLSQAEGNEMVLVVEESVTITSEVTEEYGLQGAGAVEPPSEVCAEEVQLVPDTHRFLERVLLQLGLECAL